MTDPDTDETADLPVRLPIKALAVPAGQWVPAENVIVPEISAFMLSIGLGALSSLYSTGHLRDA